MSIATASAKSATAVQSKLAKWTRAEISNPPAFGARITATILGEEGLHDQWRQDLVTMSSRIQTMRDALYQGLKKRSRYRLHVQDIPSSYTQQILPGTGSALSGKKACSLFLAYPRKVLQLRRRFCFIYHIENALTWILYPEKHHIYMADSSRIWIAGLNWNNVDRVADAVHVVGTSS